MVGQGVETCAFTRLSLIFRLPHVTSKRVEADMIMMCGAVRGVRVKLTD